MASAAWAVLAVSTSTISLQAAGATLLDDITESMDAEFTALELAIGALLKISRGYDDVAPHRVDVIITEPQFLNSSGLEQIGFSKL
eukprot:7539100-Karenia_brevis.AAC.1